MGVRIPDLSAQPVAARAQAAVRSEGRSVPVCATQTGIRDIVQPFGGILVHHGFWLAVMEANAGAPDRRAAWVALQVGTGVIIEARQSTGNFFSLRNVLPIRGQQTQRLGGSTTCGFRCS